MSQTSNKLILGLAGVAAIGVLVFLGLPSDPTRQAVKITFPGGGELEMDVSRPEIDHASLLERLFSEQFTRDGVLGWLAEQGVLSIQDARLVSTLESELCEEIPRAPIDARLQKASECASNPVAHGLRTLAEHRKVPFHYVGLQVRVGVQADTRSRPGKGKANVCRESDLLGKEFELTDLASGRNLILQASGYYNCTGYSRYPEVQLDPADARDLFRRPLREYERAVAVPLD